MGWAPRIGRREFEIKSPISSGRQLILAQFIMRSLSKKITMVVIGDQGKHLLTFETIR
jgi:hypothetical protein